MSDNNRWIRDLLSPANLHLIQTVAKQGSFAAAARKMDMVPSAMTYRIRQIEDGLDVLLFDRRSRQARLTSAGEELIRQSEHLLHEVDALAHRIKRVSTGWEPQLTIAVDTIVNETVIMELCAAFYRLDPPTRLRIRHEALSGTLAALASGQADLAIGMASEATSFAGLQTRHLGEVRFVFAVAPSHPLAKIEDPLTDEQLHSHRAIAIADSVAKGQGLTIGLLGGQDVLTVSSVKAKLNAQILGLGAGFLPEYIVKPELASGRLVEKQVLRPERVSTLNYAWKTSPKTQTRALHWWLDQLDSPVTKLALVN